MSRTAYQIDEVLSRDTTPAEKIRREGKESVVRPEGRRLEDGIKQVEAILSQNQTRLERIAAAKAAEEASNDAWKERASRDAKYNNGQTPTPDVYQDWIRRWQKKLSEAQNQTDTETATKAIAFYEQSLLLCDAAERSRAETRHVQTTEPKQDLYRFYTEEPEALRGYVFTEAIKHWDLPAEVKRYAEAIVVRERAKEDYIAARTAWYEEHAGEAYTQLKTRQREFVKNADALESWESSTHVSDEEPSQDQLGHLLKPRSTTRGHTALFRYSLNQYVTKEAIAPMEERFQGLHADLYEEKKVADQALVEACAAFVPQLMGNSEWIQKLRQYDYLRAVWPKEELAPDAAAVARVLLRTGGNGELASVASNFDEGIKRAIDACKEIRTEIRYVKQEEVQDLRDELRAERDSLMAGARELEGFQRVERENALASQRGTLMKAEEVVMQCYQEAGSERVDRFLTSLDSALFQNNVWASAVPDHIRMIADPEMMKAHLVLYKHHIPPNDRLTSSRYEMERLRKMAKQQDDLSGFLESCLKGVDGSTTFTSEVSNVVERLKEGPLAPRPERHQFTEFDGYYRAEERWESYSPFPESQSATVDHPLAEAQDVSAFGQAFSSINDSALATRSLEARRRVGMQLRTLIHGLEAVNDARAKQVSASLRVRYAITLQGTGV